MNDNGNCGCLFPAGVGNNDYPTFVVLSSCDPEVIDIEAEQEPENECGCPNPTDICSQEVFPGCMITTSCINPTNPSEVTQSSELGGLTVCVSQKLTGGALVYTVAYQCDLNPCYFSQGAYHFDDLSGVYSHLYVMEELDIDMSEADFLAEYAEGIWTCDPCSPGFVVPNNPSAHQAHQERGKEEEPKEELNEESNKEIVKSEFKETYESTVYPNPFNDLLNIEVNVPESINATIEVYNVLGKKLTEKTQEFTRGNNLLAFSFDDIQVQGLTYVMIKFEDGVQHVHKVIRVRE